VLEYQKAGDKDSVKQEMPSDGTHSSTEGHTNAQCFSSRILNIYNKTYTDMNQLKFNHKETTLFLCLE
jgi:hypothetical protein